MDKSRPQIKTPIATDMFLPNHSGDISAGRVLTTPTENTQPVNKEYVDREVATAGVWELNLTSPYGYELKISDDIILKSDFKCYFRDAEIFIHSNADGEMTIEADTLVTIGVAGDIELGDSTERDMFPTIDLKINLGTSTKSFNDAYIGGDIYLTDDGGGLQFAEIYLYDNSTSDTVATATWVQLTRFDNDGESNGAVPDHTNDHITITKAGKYHVTLHSSFSGSGSVTWTGGVFINNGATQLENVQVARKLGAAGDVGSMTVCGIVDMAVNDTVEVWFMHTAGVNKDITVVHCTLSLFQIGG